MKFLAFILSACMSISTFTCQSKQELLAFYLPTLGASSATQQPDDKKVEDDEADQSSSLEQQLKQVEKNLESLERMKQVEIERANHYRQKATAFYHANQIDKFREYMKHSLESDEKILKLETSIQELKIKRHNLLFRMKKDQPENNVRDKET